MRYALCVEHDQELPSLLEFLLKLVDRSRLGITVQKIFPEGYEIIFIDWRSSLWYRATLCWSILDFDLWIISKSNVIASWSEITGTMSGLLILGWEEKTKSNILSCRVGRCTNYSRLASLIISRNNLFKLLL